jgi:formiminotetrahydrofolate cyclodeaminase
MLTEMKTTEFIEELASSSPAPGGGSVAALAGANAAALVSMVCNLTIGKKNYDAVQEDIKKTLESSQPHRKRLLQLIDEDTDAFNGVMSAFRLPKETEDEKAARSVAIQEAMKKAALVPMETARESFEVLKLSEVIAAKGNKNSITDSISAAITAHSAIKMAALNVRINLSSIKDESFKAQRESELSEIEAEAREIKKRVEGHASF